MSNLISTMSEALPSLPRKLALAARYAIDNPERIAFDSMRSVATTLGVASPTMLRLARTFGFESYEAFRAEFQISLARPGFADRAAGLQSAFKKGETPALSRGIAEAASRNIERALFDLDAAAVDHFANTLRKAPRSYIIGSGSMQWIAGLMQSTGVIALSGLRRDDLAGATSVEALASITDQDAVLALGIAPYARRTVEAATYARDCGAETFCITDRRSSPLAQVCKTSFLAQTESPHYYPSTVAVVLVAEILLSAALASDASLDRIAAFDRARHATGAYID